MVSIIAIGVAGEEIVFDYKVGYDHEIMSGFVLVYPTYQLHNRVDITL